MRYLLFLVLVLTLPRVSSAQSYFPIQSNNQSAGISQFEEKWYSEHLSAMKEPSMFAQQSNTAREEYRFLWLRTFHKPIAIRIWSDPPGAQMRVVRLSGAGGYDPGHIESDTTIKVTADDWKGFHACIKKAQFWQMPTNPKVEELGFDGAQWILEAREAAKYHIVVRWTPRGGDYADCCRLLVAFAKLQIPKDEFY